MKKVACSVFLGLHFLLLSPHSQAIKVTPKVLLYNVQGVRMKLTISPFRHERMRVNVREFYTSYRVCEGEDSRAKWFLPLNRQNRKLEVRSYMSR